MNFTEWLSLSDAEREAERRTWQVFEPGHWHSIAVEAAARFAAQFGSTPHVQRVFKSLYSGDELIVAVQTDLSPPEMAQLPSSYDGFRVMQFAGKVPAGVLVDPGPPSTPASVGPDSPGLSRSVLQTSGNESHKILPLDGEIDFHISPRVALELGAVINEQPKHLLVDLSKVTYIDSSGLAALIEGMRKVEAYGGKFYLIGMQKITKSIFETSGLDQAFRIFSDADSALAS